MNVRHLAIGVIALIGVYLISAFSVPAPGSTIHATSDRFWSLARLNADEVESFVSLESMTESVDLIVIGHIVATSPSRSFRAMEADAEIDTAWYASVQVVADWSSSTVVEPTFEVFFPTKFHYEVFLAAATPGETAIFFLRNKEVAALAAGWPKADASKESQYFMLANQEQALLRDLGGKVHVVDTESRDFTSALEGTSFEGLVAKVKALRGLGPT